MMPVANTHRQPTIQKQIDSGAMVGIALAFGGVLTALLMQGGEVADLFQWSSAILLLAGTAGAILITTPLAIVRDALANACGMFSVQRFDTQAVISLLTGLSRKANRLGLVALETELEVIPIPLLHEAVRMASDGSSVEEVGSMMRLETRLTQKRLDRQARVFEAAGGFAPTLGILGAVLGLIQVMKHLTEMTAVGHGIAAAFVSTVYGLALANLVLLPIAGRLRATSSQRMETQELLTEGVISIMQKQHPLVMEARLAPFLVKAGSDRTSPLPQPGSRPKIVLARGA